jgi:hypothetical protein
MEKIVELHQLVDLIISHAHLHLAIPLTTIEIAFHSHGVVMDKMIVLIKVMK